MRINYLFTARTKEFRVDTSWHVRHRIDPVVLFHLFAILGGHRNHVIKTVTSFFFKIPHLDPLSSQIGLLERVSLHFAMTLPNHRFYIVLKKHSAAVEIRRNVKG